MIEKSESEGFSVIKNNLKIQNYEFDNKET